MKFPYRLRFEHCYVPGKNGHGKTTLLQHMALTDIEWGAGVTFIDPGGDAVGQLLHHIPKDRIDHCIYLDLEHPIPFDFLTYDGPTEKDELVKDLTFILLKGIANAPRAESILVNLLYTLLACTIPVCFLDVYYFLTKESAPWGSGKNRYDDIMAALPDPSLRHHWQNDFPTKEEKKPILTRLTPLVRNSTLHKLFGTPNPPLKIADVMNRRKILLVNIGGASQAAVEYGSLLFAKIRQETFRRHKIPLRERIPHFLYIDEFQTIPNPATFRDCLMMGRKYKLALTLANLTLEDPELDPRIKAALGIITNYIIFSLSPKDVPFFKHLIPSEYHPRLHLQSSIDRLDARIAALRERPDSDELRIQKLQHERDIDAKMLASTPANQIITPNLLNRLDKYEAVYKIGSRFAYQQTPKPLAPSRASYAKSIRNRTIQTYSCDSPDTWSTTEPDDNQRSKPDDISAGKLPNVPPHGGKEKNP